MRPRPDRNSLFESELSALKDEAAQLRARLGELRGCLIESEGLLALADYASDLRRRQSDYLHQEVARSAQEAARLHREAHRLHRELVKRQEIIDTILSSWSWRVTSSLYPNRQAAQTVSRLLSDLNAPPPIHSEGQGDAHSQDLPLAYRGMRYVARDTDRVDSNKLEVKAIAFYLPKLRSLREARSVDGDNAGGWSNVVHGLPRYFGQRQPRLPDDFDYYDAGEPDVMRRQIDLAQQYGIHGFCFYHYWAGGKHALEPPLSNFLSDEGSEFKFCLCWMNDNPECGKDFLEPLAPVLSDRRYIRIEEKPLLIVFQPALLRDAVDIVRHWKNRAKTLGFPGLYLVAVNTDVFVDPRSIEFDAGLEFPPLQAGLTDVTLQHSLVDADFGGRIYSYAEMADASSKPGGSACLTFPTVIPGWDEEGARPGEGDCAAGANPALYANWLKKACDGAMLGRPAERLIFIHAWNAWLDGAYLEPDRQLGYAYLHATVNVLRGYHNDPDTWKLIEDINAGFKRTHDAAIVFHCHYEDLIAPIFDQYISRIKDADLFITARNDLSKSAIEEVHRRFPNAFFIRVENRGRDLRPFLLALRHLKALGYTIACKVHTKKSPHIEVGEGKQWRQKLIAPLLGSEDSVSRAALIFARETDVGLLVPEGSVMDLKTRHVYLQNTYWLDRLLYRMDRSDLVGKYTFSFPAGSMYWFRVSALSGLEDLILAEDAFEQELGQKDGMLHHAVERLVGLYAQQRDYSMKEVSFSTEDSPQPVSSRIDFARSRVRQDTSADCLESEIAGPLVLSKWIRKQRDLIYELQRQLKAKERDWANEAWVRRQLMQSFSWRITAPVRGFARLVRWLLSVFKSPARGPQTEVADVAEPPAVLNPDISSELKELRAELFTVDLEVFMSTGAILNLPCGHAPEISVILALSDRCDLAFASLRSIERVHDHALEVIIVDNMPSSKSSEMLDRVRGARIVRKHENLNLLALVNEATRLSRGDYILFLTSAAQLMPGSLDAALSTARSSPNVGAVGGRIIQMDGSLQEAGRIVWQDGSCVPYGRGDHPLAPMYMFRREVDCCSNAFLLTQRRIFEEMNGFCEIYQPGTYEDTDYCFRIREMGMRVVYEPNAVVLCHGSDGSDLQPAQQRTFANRHCHALGRLFPPDQNLIWKARSAERRRSVLFLEDRVPHRWLGAGLPRARAILETLGKNSFVTFYPLIVCHEEWSTVYADTPRDVEVILDSGPALLEEFLSRRRGYYDTILVSRPHNMKLLRPILEHHPDWFNEVNVIYDAQALCAARDSGLRGLAGLPMSAIEEAATIRAEIEVAVAADVVISVSRSEKEEFAKNGIDRVYILGHSIAPDPTPRKFEEREGFIFVGATREASPNVDSLIWFFEDILPIIRARLGQNVPVAIAGICDSERIRNLASDAVRILGPVDDLRELYDRARVFVAPARYAAGIPHKVHEAAAHGLPCVVTPLLAAQLGWHDACEVGVGSDSQSFAARCLWLYEEKDAWQRLRRNALNRVKEECSAEAFEEKLEGILRKI